MVEKCNKIIAYCSVTKSTRIKKEMKRYYDKYHKVQTEPFAVGDKVLMINKRIPAHSTRVLTPHNYNGPYIIASKIQR